MNLLRHTLDSFLLTYAVATVVACAASDTGAEALGADAGTGGTCAIAGCIGTNGAAGLAPVVVDVEHQSTGGSSTAEPPTTLAALCGRGCSEDEDGAPLFPEDPAACTETEGYGGGDGEGGAPAVLGCSIVAGSDGSPVGQCGLRSDGVLGDPCLAQADCAPGFACVGEDNAGQCRPYCCADAEACPVGTYCAAQTLLDLDRNQSATPLEVPVCVEAQDCRLDDPYPCSADQTCTCATNMACTVVRSDGTTGCVPAVTDGGLEGEACPCSPVTVNGPGLICSQTTQTCLALCRLAESAPCGAGRRCQSSASLPDGFGICTTDVSNASNR
jgi:hypothetical protein